MIVHELDLIIYELAAKQETVPLQSRENVL